MKQFLITFRNKNGFSQQVNVDAKSKSEACKLFREQFSLCPIYCDEI